jgi:hypothetical protein
MRRTFESVASVSVKSVIPSLHHTRPPCEQGLHRRYSNSQPPKLSCDHNKPQYRSLIGKFTFLNCARIGLVCFSAMKNIMSSASLADGEAASFNKSLTTINNYSVDALMRSTCNFPSSAVPLYLCPYIGARRVDAVAAPRSATLHRPHSLNATPHLLRLDWHTMCIL